MIEAKRLAPVAAWQVGGPRGCNSTRDEEDEAIYAVALVMLSELNSQRPSLVRAWPIENTSCSVELIAAINDGDQARELAKKQSLRSVPEIETSGTRPG